MNGKISIVTINYNASGETIDFLNALKEQTEKSFDVILVDNGSSKVDLDALNVWLEKTYIPGLSVLKNGENSGFSGGCNIGIKKALDFSKALLLPSKVTSRNIVRQLDVA